MHHLVQSFLNRFGKHYTVDPRIPAAELFRICFLRVLWLIWGVVRTQSVAFVSPLAIIENARNLQLGKAATLEAFTYVNATAERPVFIGERTKIGAYSRIVATAHLSKLGKGFSIGDDSGCGEFCYFGAVGGIVIGKRVIMGQYVSFHAQEHAYADTSVPIKDQGTHEKGIAVGDDCWIGAKATLLDGTVLGKHCVIAAGAVVKGQFPDHSVIGGVPARILSELKDAA